MEERVNEVASEGSGEVRIYIIEEQGRRFLDLRVFERPTGGEGLPPGEKEITIPLKLFPQLKRSILELEEALISEHLLNDELEEEGEKVRTLPFAHPSEEEFAKILDFYQIKWLYEPKTFPLEWDAEGRITESLTPDFYLPDLDLYIELTTLKQDLVTRKNRKIKRLRELYPEVNLKVFYGRDFRSLLRRYRIAKNE